LSAWNFFRSLAIFGGSFPGAVLGAAAADFKAAEFRNRRMGVPNTPNSPAPRRKGYSKEL